MWFPDGSYEKEDPPNCTSAPVTGRSNTNAKHKVKRGNKIERRKQATVDVAGAELNRIASTENCLPNGYSTIESNSIQGLDKFDNWNKDDDEESCVSGWRGDENIAKMIFLQNDSATTIHSSRNALQSRDASNRLYSSHLTTQMSKKREKYKFTHAYTAEDHIKTYKELCGFSYLVLGSKRSSNSKDTLVEKQEMPIEKEIDNSKPDQLPMQPNNKSSSSSQRNHSSTNVRSTESKIPSIPIVTGLTVTDRVLHALANRLGVKESIDEPKLLYSPVQHQTPPSITKKKSTEPREDLTVYARTKSDIADLTSSTNTSNSTESRPSTKQSKQRRSPYLLPKIERKHKSTSSISLSKYFHVNTKTTSNAQGKNEEEEGVQEVEDSIIAHSSRSSLLYSLASNQSHDKFPYCEKFSAPTPQLNLAMDRFESDLQKEVAIRRKADSLGLLSHKWAKNFIERGFMNGSLSRKIYYDYSSSRQLTQQNKRINNNNNDKRMFSSTKRKEKMQELKNVYSSAKPTKNNNRTCSRKSATRKGSRTATATKHNRDTNKSHQPTCSTGSRTTKPQDTVEMFVKKKSEFYHSTKRQFQLHGTHAI